jgi:hypothetical protein
MSDALHWDIPGIVSRQSSNFLIVAAHLRRNDLVIEAVNEDLRYTYRQERERRTLGIRLRALLGGSPYETRHGSVSELENFGARKVGDARKRHCRARTYPYERFVNRISLAGYLEGGPHIGRGP